MAYISFWLHEYKLESYGGKTGEEIPGIITHEAGIELLENVLHDIELIQLDIVKIAESWRL